MFFSCGMVGGYFRELLERLRLGDKLRRRFISSVARVAPEESVIARTRRHTIYTHKENTEK